MCVQVQCLTNCTAVHQMITTEYVNQLYHNDPLFVMNERSLSTSLHTFSIFTIDSNGISKQPPLSSSDLGPVQVRVRSGSGHDRTGQVRTVRISQEWSKVVSAEVYGRLHENFCKNVLSLINLIYLFSHQLSLNHVKTFLELLYSMSLANPCTWK